MTKGAYGQYVIRHQTIESFTQFYERVLWEFKFQTKEKTWDGRGARHKAILGSKAGSFAMSHLVPFGSWTEEGNRYGAEAEIYQHGPDIIFRLLVVPYMSIFDSHDYFLLSQGVVEKILDDDRCMQKIVGIVQRLYAYGVHISPY
jgi:hypothetical protein